MSEAAGAYTVTPALGARETVRRWETAERYYLAHVARDLFGQWVVWTAWGGRGRQRGGHRLEAVADRDAAAAALARVTCERHRHGYELVDERRY